MTECSTMNKSNNVKGLGNILEERAERMLGLKDMNGYEML